MHALRNAILIVMIAIAGIVSIPTSVFADGGIASLDDQTISVTIQKDGAVGFNVNFEKQVIFAQKLVFYVNNPASCGDVTTWVTDKGTIIITGSIDDVACNFAKDPTLVEHLKKQHPTIAAALSSVPAPTVTPTSTPTASPTTVPNTTPTVVARGPMKPFTGNVVTRGDVKDWCAEADRNLCPTDDRFDAPASLPRGAIQLLKGPGAYYTIPAGVKVIYFDGDSMQEHDGSQPLRGAWMESATFVPTFIGK